MSLLKDSLQAMAKLGNPVGKDQFSIKILGSDDQDTADAVALSMVTCTWEFGIGDIAAQIYMFEAPNITPWVKRTLLANTSLTLIFTMYDESGKVRYTDTRSCYLKSASIDCDASYGLATQLGPKRRPQKDWRNEFFQSTTPTNRAWLEDMSELKDLLVKLGSLIQSNGGKEGIASMKLVFANKPSES